MKKKKTALIITSIILGIILSIIIFSLNIFYVNAGNTIGTNRPGGGYIRAWAVTDFGIGVNYQPEKYQIYIDEINLEIEKIYTSYTEKYPEIVKIDCNKVKISNCKFSLNFKGTGTTKDGKIENVDKLITVDASPIKHEKSAIITIKDNIKN